MFDLLLSLLNIIIIGTGYKLIELEEHKTHPNANIQKLGKGLLIMGVILTVYLATRLPAIFLHLK